MEVNDRRGGHGGRRTAGGPVHDGGDPAEVTHAERAVDLLDLGLNVPRLVVELLLAHRGPGTLRGLMTYFVLVRVFVWVLGVA